MRTYRFSYTSDLGWANGEAPSRFAGSPATYSTESAGIDPFRTPGLLRSGMVGEHVLATDITSTLRCMRLCNVYDGTSNFESLFALDEIGSFWEIRNANLATITAMSLASSTNGVFLEDFRDHVYISGASVVMKYGDIHAATPTLDTAFWTTMRQSIRGWTNEKPLRSWNGSLYCGDGNLLKSLDGSETSGTTGDVPLTLDDDEIITQISDNGDYLLFGTMNSAANSSNGKTRAYFYKWNGTDTTYSAKYAFPEDKIIGISVLGTEIIVFGKKRLYQLNGNDFSALGEISPQATSIDCVDRNDGQVWWKDSNCVRSIGSPDPQLPKGKNRPFAGTGTTYGAIKWTSPERLFVSDDGKLYRFQGGNQVGVSFYSRQVSEAAMSYLNEVRLYFGEPLASGDSLTVKLKLDSGTEKTLKEVSFAAYGAITELTLRDKDFTQGPGQFSAWQAVITFNSGDPKLKTFIYEISPLAQP